MIKANRLTREIEDKSFLIVLRHSLVTEEDVISNTDSSSSFQHPNYNWP